MINLNSVQLLGKVTLEPKVRTLQSGSKVAEIGLGIPENYRTKDGEWSSRMHFVDVVLWNEQAELAEKRLKKGEGLLVQGSLQYESWETKDGGKRSKVKVRAQRIQTVPLPEQTASDEDAA